MAKAQDLKTRFQKEITPKLEKELKIKNIMALPKVTKVKINVGIGSYVKKQNKDYSHILENIAKISGQKPTVNKAKKAISNFKIRAGEDIGLSVTLRGQRMYDFINKLVNVVFPRVRDFRGLSDRSFDGNGNYSIGFREHTVFPEISPDDVINLHGVQVVITTSAQNNESGLALLKALGFPFKAAVIPTEQGGSEADAQSEEITTDEPAEVAESTEETPNEESAEPAEEPKSEDSTQ